MSTQSLRADAEDAAALFPPLDDAEINLLAEALFDEQERMLPEGESWSDLSENDKSFWRNSALAVVHRLREMGRM
jgi:hypothetical protein